MKVMYFNYGLKRSLTKFDTCSFFFFNASYVVTKTKFLHERDSNPKRIDNHHRRACHRPT